MDNRTHDRQIRTQLAWILSLSLLILTFIFFRIDYTDFASVANFVGYGAGSYYQAYPGGPYGGDVDEGDGDVDEDATPDADEGDEDIEEDIYPGDGDIYPGDGDVIPDGDGDIDLGDGDVDVSDDAGDGDVTDDGGDGDIVDDSGDGDVVDDGDGDGDVVDDAGEDEVADDAREDEVTDDAREDEVADDIREDEITEDAREDEITDDAREDEVTDDTREDEVADDIREDEITDDAGEDEVADDAREDERADDTEDEREDEREDEITDEEREDEREDADEEGEEDVVVCDDKPGGGTYTCQPGEGCCGGSCYNLVMGGCCTDKPGGGKYPCTAPSLGCCKGVCYKTYAEKCCDDKPDGKGYSCPNYKECCGGKCIGTSSERCCTDGPAGSEKYDCKKDDCCNKGSCLAADSFCGPPGKDFKCKQCYGSPGSCEDNDYEDCSTDGSSCAECLDGGCMPVGPPLFPSNPFCGGGGLLDQENPAYVCKKCSSGTCSINNDGMLCGKGDGCQKCGGGNCNSLPDKTVCKLPGGLTPGEWETCDRCYSGTCKKDDVNCVIEMGDKSKCWRCLPSNNPEGYECKKDCLSNCQECILPGEEGNPSELPHCYDKCDDLGQICSLCIPSSLTDQIGYCHYFCADCEACKPPAGPDPSKCVDNCKGTQSECFCGLWWEEEKCVGCMPLLVCRDKKCVSIFNPSLAAMEEAFSSPKSCKPL